MTTSINTLFRLHFPEIHSVNASPHQLLPKSPSSSVISDGNIPTSPPPLALGMLQWGTTPFDDKIINGPRGMLSEPEARDIYQTFRKHGVVLFDTAEGYGGGTSEKRLGRLMRLERTNEAGEEKLEGTSSEEDDDGATVGTDVTEDASSPDTTTPDDSMTNTHNNIILMTKFLPVPWRFTHRHFEKALRASNTRMGITECPIYLLHSPMHVCRDIEYWVESAAMCKKKGLLKHFGLSNCSAGEVRKAVEAGKKHGVTVVLNQVNYSLLDYNSQALHEMQAACNELGVAIIAYNSLGQGLLTDNLTEEKFKTNKPAKMMRIGWSDLIPLRTELRNIADAHSIDATTKEEEDKNVISKEKKVSMAQVAMSWCRAKGTIPLVGCRSKKQAEDTMASLSLELSAKEVGALDALALKRCTLDSPAWRRKLFVALAGMVMTVCRWLDFWGVGAGRIQL